MEENCNLGTKNALWIRKHFKVKSLIYLEELTLLGLQGNFTVTFIVADLEDTFQKESHALAYDT